VQCCYAGHSGIREKGAVKHCGFFGSFLKPKVWHDFLFSLIHGVVTSKFCVIWCTYSSTTSGDCPGTLVIHNKNAPWRDFTFRYLKRRRDRAIGKQPLATAQRYRINHQPEHIDQVMPDKRLKQI